LLDYETAFAQSTGIATEATPAAVAFAGRLVGDEASTRLLLDFDQPVEVSVLYMVRPSRIVINLPKIVFKFSNDEALAGRGLVSDVRFGAISKDASRLVLTLKSPAKVTKSEVKKLENEKQSRLVIDFDAISSAEFAQLVTKQQEVSGRSGAIATKGDRIRKSAKKAGRFRIVIDPGHGGIDGGAVGVRGGKEKDITLAVARQFKANLEKAGPFDVELTRNDDIFVSLKERVAIARRSSADLFISIHADSLQQRHVRGATIYTLSKKASDKLSAQLARSENLADLVAGLALPTEDNAVTDILVELTARETVRFSRYFSQILSNSLKDKTILIKNPQRSASFGVLKAPEVPSVLLELGYLSNLEDEKLMRSKKWQAELAHRVGDAIAKFFKLRQP